MGKKRRNRNKFSPEDVILEELSQRADELGDVRAELEHYKKLWTSSMKDIPKNIPPANLPPNVTSTGENLSNFSKDIANKALNAIKTLEEKCNNIEFSLKNAHASLNELEQYLRRANLLIHGLHDIPMDKYDYDFIVYIVDKLNSLLPTLNNIGKITPDDINDAHPLFQSESKSPVVIVQFNKRWIRNEILKMKNKLAYPNVGFTEHLTKCNMELLKETKALVGSYYAWSRKGVVYARLDDGSKVTVKSKDDVVKLKNSGCKPRVPVKKNSSMHNNANHSSPRHAKVPNADTASNPLNPPVQDNDIYDSRSSIAYSNQLRGRGIHRGAGSYRGNFVGRGYSTRGGRGYSTRGGRGRGVQFY